VRGLKSLGDQTVQTGAVANSVNAASGILHSRGYLAPPRSLSPKLTCHVKLASGWWGPVSSQTRLFGLDGLDASRWPSVSPATVVGLFDARASRIHRAGSGCRSQIRAGPSIGGNWNICRPTSSGISPSHHRHGFKFWVRFDQICRDPPAFQTTPGSRTWSVQRFYFGLISYRRSPAGLGTSSCTISAPCSLKRVTARRGVGRHDRDITAIPLLKHGSWTQPTTTPSKSHPVHPRRG